MTHPAPAPLICIIDDDEGVRVSAGLLLAAHGFRVSTFDDGESLLENLHVCAAAAFILDLQLPGASGIEILKKMRARGITAPVIIASANAKQHFQKAIQAGAAAVMDKPYPTTDLIQLLSRLLRGDT